MRWSHLYAYVAVVMAKCLCATADRVDALDTEFKNLTAVDGSFERSIDEHEEKAHRQKRHKRHQGKRHHHHSEGDDEKQQDGEAIASFAVVGVEEATSVENFRKRDEERSAIEDLQKEHKMMEDLKKAEDALLKNNQEMEEYMKMEAPVTVQNSKLHMEKIDKMWADQNTMCGKVNLLRKEEAPLEKFKPEYEEMKSNVASNSQNFKVLEVLIQLHESRVAQNKEVRRILQICEEAKEQNKLQQELETLVEVIQLETTVLNAELTLIGLKKEAGTSLARLCEKVHTAIEALSTFCSRELANDRMNPCVAKDTAAIQNRIDEVKQSSEKRNLMSQTTSDVIAAWEERYNIKDQQNAVKKQVTEANLRCDMEDDLAIELPSQGRTTTSAPEDDSDGDHSINWGKSQAFSFHVDASSMLVVLVMCVVSWRSL